MRWLFTVPVSFLFLFFIPIVIYKATGRNYKVNYHLLKATRSVLVFTSCLFNTALLVIDSSRGLIQLFRVQNADCSEEAIELGAAWFGVLPFFVFVLLVSIACFHLGRRVGQWKTFVPDKTFSQFLDVLVEQKGGVRNGKVIAI